MRLEGVKDHPTSHITKNGQKIPTIQAAIRQIAAVVRDSA
tara:strand:+ start:936 stop:1055 length:120 start_codon:yes stop_codon:yes gene_type:complete